MIKTGVGKSLTATILSFPVAVIYRLRQSQVAEFEEVSMTDAEYSRKLAELDQLLNDPDVPMQPDRIWSILADVSRRDLPNSGYAGMSRLEAGPAP